MALWRSVMAQGRHMGVREVVAVRALARRPYSDDVKDIVRPGSKDSADNFTKRHGLTDHRVNRLEKYLLVWGGKYKTVAEVPDLVSQDTLERARNKARIKINLMMAAATLVGCLLMARAGKKMASEGQSVTKINQEWHRKINEEAKLEAEEAKLEAEKTA